VSRALADFDALVEVRATSFVRLVLACRRPVSRERVRLKQRRDAALGRLIAAVQDRDRERERQLAAIARAPSRKPRGRS
jgi:hypothetical protein